MAARRSISQTRTVGGQMVIPDGHSVFVTAPWTGTLLQAKDQPLPQAGQTVKAGQSAFLLLPLLSPEREVPTAAERVSMADAKASLVAAQIVAEGEVQQSEAQVEAAQIALDRANKLFRDKVGSERDVDNALAVLDLAQETLQAAQTRRDQLQRFNLEAESGTVAAVPIAVPQDGIVRTVSCSVGQMVSTGAPLFEVVRLSQLWVRVPLYPGLRRQVPDDAQVLVRELGADVKHVSARPIAAPPSADPIAATVDLYFEIDNSDARFRPGERVEVLLPIGGQQESIVVPRGAILRDIHGVAWVYVQSAPEQFHRQRVEVHYTTEKMAVLSQGPEVGTAVVVDGAAELFGTEFGAGK